MGKGSVNQPFEFWVQDTDGDSLYDYLWVNVTLDVTIQDLFTFTLSLNDAGNTTSFASADNTTYLLSGSHKVPLLVKGYFINLGLDDGPYSVNVMITNELYQTVAWPSGMTSPYMRSEFEASPVVAGIPTGDVGVDLDVPPDGMYNQLRVQFPVTYTEAGSYVLMVMLSGVASITDVMMVVNASVGTSTYTIAFSGVDIRMSGEDGPYTVLAMVMPAFGMLTALSSNMGMTGPYTATQFQLRSTVTISGTVTDSLGAPVLNAIILFTNYTDLFQVMGFSDIAGSYSLDVYAGDFSVVVDGADSGDYVQNMTVTTPGPYDITLELLVPDTMNMVIDMGSPDSAIMTVNETMTSGFSFLRMLFDWYFGNKDGYFSPAESDFLVGMPGAVAVDDTDYGFHVDGIFYYPNNERANMISFDLSGPVMSKLPVELYERIYTASNSTIPRQPVHVARLNVTYDLPSFESSFTLNLPPGWIATGYDPLVNVSVSGIGTGTVVVDPLNASGPATFAWQNITISDTTYVPFTVEGQTAVPNPAEYVTSVLVSAWVNDTVPTSRVDVEVRTPSGPVLGNFSMTLNAVTGRYEYTVSSYAELGVYQYTIWAIDTSGYVASASGSFTVQDTTPPVADAGPDQLVPVGTNVALNGGGSTDNFFVDNWTWNFFDGLANVELYGVTASHVFNVAGDYLVTLTVRDTVPLDNADTMWVNVSNQNIIPPTVEGQKAVPDPAEYVTPVLISAWVNDTSPIDTVSIKMTSPTGDVLGNFSMTFNAASGKYEYTLGAYAELGTYSFEIWANDTDDNWGHADGTFVVQDTTAPVANAGPDRSVSNGTLVAFDGSGSTDNCGLVNWTWSFDNGTANVFLYGATASSTFTGTGPHVVTLTVKDEAGLQDSDTMTVFVEYPPTPNPPTSVQGTQSAVDTVTLTWTAPTQNTDGSSITGSLTYNVYRSTDPATGYAKVNAAPVSGTQYTETGLATGTYYYKAEAVNEWGNASVLSSPPAAVIVTDKGQVSGVVSSGGQPLAGATVEILDQGGAIVNSTTTGSGGTFSFGNLSPGTYTVRASKSGYVSAEKSVSVTALQTATVDLSLAPVSEEAGLPWIWIILVIVIIVVVVIAVLLARRRKKPTEETGAAQESSQTKET